MLSISCVQGDGSYYTTGGEPARWLGDAVALLGLSHEVDHRVFKRLLQGRTPDGTGRLLAPHPRRDLGWDLTFSAPKSVSVLRAFVSDDLKQRIDACHDAALSVALRFVQSQAGFVRRGKGGVTREPASLLFLVRTHEVSRHGDPQHHSHCVVVNLAVRQDGTCGAVHSPLLYRAKMLAGAVYQAELANNLRLRLGLEIVPTRVAFRIRGVPKTLCRALSKRRADIEAAMAKVKSPQPRDIQKAAVSTRPKTAEKLTPELQKAWTKEAATHSWGHEMAERLLEAGRSRQPSPDERPSVTPPTATIETEPASAPKPPLARSAGRWSGDAVALLGLSKSVDPVVLQNLLKGLSPDGKRTLFAISSGQSNARTLTFTAPSSVAVLHSFAGRKNQRRLAACHDAAVAVALRYLQTQAGFTTPTMPGLSHEPASLLFNVTRDQVTTSPEMKTTALLIDFAVRADRSCGPLPNKIVEEAMQITHAVYETELAKNLNTKLGLQIAPTNLGFHVRGVPEKLCRELAEGDSIPPADPMKHDAVAVRQTEPHRETWDRTAEKHGWGRTQAEHLICSHFTRVPDVGGFFRRLTDEVQHIPKARRTASAAVGLARTLALESSIGGVQMLRAMQNIPVFREKLYQVQWVPLFPKAPCWSPFSLVKVPEISAGGRPRHWGRVIGRKEFMNVELRVQMRRLFPNLPAWHTGSKIQLPALRFAIPEARQLYEIRRERGQER